MRTCLPTIRSLPLLALAAGLLGCPSAPPAEPDPLPTPDDGGTTEVTAPTAPVDPAPAVLTPCPSGWNAVPATAGGPSLCEPWAVDAGAGCADDAAHFPGEAGCRTVGTPCGADDWATDLPTSGAMLFVKAGAIGGGTGTRQAPFATISAAMAMASPGAVIAVARGSYQEEVQVRAGVTVWGACVAQTHLSGLPGGRAAVSTAGLNGAMKNLTIGGPTVGVLANPSGNSLTLSSVRIDGAVGVALLVGNRASVTGQDVLIRNTQSSASGNGGRAVSAEYAATVSLTRFVFENNRENGVFAGESGTSVSLSDGAIRGTTARGDGNMGRAASVGATAALTLSRVVLEQNQEIALYATTGATVKLTDVLVRDTRSAASGNDAGNGLLIEGATATLLRCAVAGNRGLGLSVRSTGTLHASHLMVVGTQVEAASGKDGIGLDVIEGSTITVDHAFVAENHTGGIGLVASTGTLDDVEVQLTRAVSPGDVGGGLQVGRGATLTLHRLRLSHNDRLGLLADGAGTAVAGTDLQVLDTASDPGSGLGGSALAVQNGAAVTLGQVVLARNHAAGLQASDPGTTLTLEDLAVTDTGSEAGSGLAGRAIHLQGGVQLALHRAALTHNLDVGLLVGSGSVVQASDVRVDGVAKAVCIAAGSCADVGGSTLVVLGQGSSVTLDRFALTHSAQCGVQLADDGVATLSQGEVSDHPIGACVTTASFDTQRLADRVVYRNDGRKLDAESVPLPVVMLTRY